MSKTEPKLPPTEIRTLPDSGKWSDITLLLEWEEEFYDVYTARKHGKWVMLKTLKPALKGLPEFQAMINREFEVRYNLCSPHIVMINDLEEVPGLGLCIITDDVYGDSLRRLINERKVTPEVVQKLARQLLDAIAYVQTNHIVHHPIRPESVIFTETIGNLKVIDVGFDQRNRLSPADVTEDIRAYGEVLTAALDACPERMPALRSVAEKCLSAHPYRSVQDLEMAVWGRSNKRFYLIIITFLALMVVILGLLLFLAPATK